MKLVLEYDLEANPTTGVFADYLQVLGKSLAQQNVPNEDLRETKIGAIIETRDPEAFEEPIVARLTLVDEKFESDQKIDVDELDMAASGVYNQSGKVKDLDGQARH